MGVNTFQKALHRTCEMPFLSKSKQTCKSIQKTTYFNNFLRVKVLSWLKESLFTDDGWKFDE